MTALFGFSAVMIGAATAWSIGLLGSLAWGALSSGVPVEQQGLTFVMTTVGLLVGFFVTVWLCVFFVWVRQLPKLRTLTFVIIFAPFLFGFLSFGRGVLSVITG